MFADTERVQAERQDNKRQKNNNKKKRRGEERGRERGGKNTQGGSGVPRMNDPGPFDNNYVHAQSGNKANLCPREATCESPKQMTPVHPQLFG